ncbi:MAG TPA: hypothetical protein VGE07_13775 [Herpetosiphonaceae bacterium]
MLTYETVVTALLGEAERVGLNIVFSQEQLDPHSLVRTFTMNCYPYGMEPDGELSPSSTLSFSWSAALTALSVAGSDELCDLYHDPDEACVHSELGCAYEATLELTGLYEIPFPPSPNQQFNDAARVAKIMQEASAKLTGDRQPLPIDMNVHFTSRSQQIIARLSVRQEWVLDEQMHDEGELRESLGGICAEFGNMLHALLDYEEAPRYPLSEAARAAEHAEEQPEPERESRLHSRTYLKPPTA